MSCLFIRQFHNDDGSRYWGILYRDQNGVEQPHKENWKHVVFETEEEAVAKLDALASEREREDNAEPLTLEEAKAFAESHEWRFAKTYAKTAPHEYLVKNWLTDEDKLLYERFVQTIKHKSVVGYFYGHKNDYLILDDHYYWFMGQYDNMAVDLINRTTTDYLEYRDGAYYYKGV